MVEASATAQMSARRTASAPAERQRRVPEQCDGEPEQQPEERAHDDLVTAALRRHFPGDRLLDDAGPLDLLRQREGLLVRDELVEELAAAQDQEAGRRVGRGAVELVVESRELGVALLDRLL